MSMLQNPDQLNGVIRRMLRPIARFLLKRGISYAVFAEAAKQSFVDAASSDFAIPGKRQTTSRISTLTGLSRKEVFRLQNMNESDQATKQPKLNRAARVINGWISDRRFTDSRGRPRNLDFDQGENSFSLLVKEYSGDITPRTIVDELTRTNAVKVGNDGKLCLIDKAYIPELDSDERLSMMADDLISLFNTIEHNLDTSSSGERRFQRKVYYDRIPAYLVPELKEMINEKAQACLEALNTELRQSDRDHNLKLKDDTEMKIGLGIYYIEEKPE